MSYGQSTSRWGSQEGPSRPGNTPLKAKVAPVPPSQQLLYQRLLPILRRPSICCLLISTCLLKTQTSSCFVLLRAGKGHPCPCGDSGWFRETAHRKGDDLCAEPSAGTTGSLWNSPPRKGSSLPTKHGEAQRKANKHNPFLVLNDSLICILTTLILFVSSLTEVNGFSGDVVHKY